MNFAIPHFVYFATAVHSISIKASLGSLATCTVDLAGYISGK